MWKKTIMELRGPYPTEDSELLLHKMVDDIIEVNNHMKIFKKDNDRDDSSQKSQ